jgi:hypothetical protein
MRCHINIIFLQVTTLMRSTQNRRRKFFISTFYLSSMILQLSCVARKSQSQQSASFLPKGIPEDWGLGKGTVSASQSVEAGLANIAAKRLLLGVDMPKMLGFEKMKAIDARVAFALKFSESDIQPFGDGQTNSSVAWPGWSDGTKTLPFVAIWTQLENSGENLNALTRVCPKTKPL